MTCLYESGIQKVKLTFDTQGKVSSLWIADGPAMEDFDLAGRAVAEELASGAWAKVVARFTPKAGKTLPTAELVKAWRDATVDAGAFLNVGGVKNDRSAARITTVDVTCEFSKVKISVRISFDEALRIHGLVFNPH